MMTYTLVQPFLQRNLPLACGAFFDGDLRPQGLKLFGVFDNVVLAFLDAAFIAALMNGYILGACRMRQMRKEQGGGHEQWLRF